MNNLIQHWPDLTLLIWLLVLFILDFIFGLLKAIFTGSKRTSQKLRKSITKFLQYGGCILISCILMNIPNQPFESFSWMFGDIMLYLMIYIELVSILENMEAMSPDSELVKFFVRPLHLLITFQLRNLFKEHSSSP